MFVFNQEKTEIISDSFCWGTAFVLGRVVWEHKWKRLANSFSQSLTRPKHGISIGGAGIF